MSEEIAQTNSLLIALAHVRTDLEMTSAVLAQAQRETKAERVARWTAEADNAVLLTILREIDLTVSRPRRIQRLLEQVRNDEHPGAPLLAELEAARAVVHAATLLGTGPDSVTWTAMYAAIEAYDAVVKKSGT